MKVHIYETGELLAEAVSDQLIDTIRQNPDAVLCMASGNSPKASCAAWVQKIKRTGLDISRILFVGLDEWVSIAPERRGSCRYDFVERICNPLGLPPSQYHLFDGCAADLQNECRKMEEVIASRKGIDLMVVGIGMNGHIGFNEPGTPFHLHSHVTALDEVTTSVGQQYFDEPMQLRQGITLGPANLMEARKVIVLAQGEKKAPLVREALEEALSTQRPASMLQEHSNAHFYIDRAAASDLRSKVEDE